MSRQVMHNANPHVLGVIERGKEGPKETLKSVTENKVWIDSPNQNSFSPLDRQLGLLRLRHLDDK
ncbi:hypothetical protein PROFUN_08366 [Planoprotostelium fungivorum]|uniref:Uncharacterized protein n=1 Tax=Planoprotostelium fungivorum TaxID=1890364 RepID=A0A2P6NJP3_9EUKA|nr:hypothetical protein PROFUN_08366 [Planoprotostelium fungivorum]